jgi:HAE1 family hydrophobic/amphiphilic exporter-1
MKKITEFSVNYPITVLMLVLGILLLGYISFQKLGIDLFPDLNNPRIFVELKAGERPPEEIEKQFVESIESLAIRQKKVSQVSSISRVGSSQITVEYSWDADMDEAFLDLQKTLSSFTQNQEIDELTITQHDPNAAPVLLLGLSHPQISDMDELRKIAQNYIRNELVRLEGIAEVEISGEEEKEVVIETDNYLLEAYGLTADAVANQIDNLNRNTSGGSIVEMGRKYIIKGVGVFQSIDDIANTIISYREPTTEEGTLQTVSTAEDRVPIYLKEVAKVYYRNKDPRSIVRIDQKRCLGLAISKETKYNTVQAVNDVLKALEDIRKALPGYELTVIQNQGEFINTAINEVKQTALIGIVLAVIVLFVFLRRIGTTAIISIAIPISVIATFNLMFFNDLSLNIMTLGGLALGAGMLVDNAIVVMENIFRNLESGMNIKDASILGTAQVGGAITSSTLTTIIVFLPIVYLHGASGELFKDQAWTVAFSLLSSLFVAILVIPMLSSRFLKSSQTQKQAKSIQFKWYGNFLGKSLEKRWWIIGGASISVVITVLLLPFVGSEFMPRADQGEFSIELRLPEGTELFRTEQTVDNLESIFKEILGDNLKTIYSRIGPASGITEDEMSIFEDQNTATMKIILKENHQLTSEEILTTLGAALGDIPDLEAQFIEDQTALQSTLGTESAPVVIEVKGEDLEILEDLTNQIRGKIETIADLYNIETAFEEGRPEVEVVVDRLRSGIYNIGTGSITSQLQDQLQGREAGQWETEGELKDITLRLPDVSLNQLGDILLTSGSQQLRLSDVADIRMGTAPREITRRNQSRTGRVTAQFKEDRPFDHVIGEIEAQIKDIDFPPNYQVQLVGEEQKRRESFQNLKFALILSIILVYMVLASQFESLVHPFTILLTIPLAGVGAILIFLFLGQALNIMAYIGIIMLAGIAVNDSIILVDAINQLRREGFSLKEAIIEAGERRIRPIIMTSLTTILALLPLTFGFGEGAALRSPMALAVIGGLISSTILTLVVIPSVYYVLDQLRFKINPVAE